MASFAACLAKSAEFANAPVPKMKRTPIGDTAEYRLDKKPDGKLPSPPIVDPLEMSGTGPDPALPVFLRGHPTAVIA
jgi:hypothetical protein